MLLDQKRTKRIVQVVAILTSVAFAGVIFVVLGLIVFGGGGSTPQSEQLDLARERVEEDPQNPDAYERLALAYVNTGDFGEATAAAERAIALDPGDYGRVQTLVRVRVQEGDTDAALATLQDYTRDNPEEAEPFLELAQRAEVAQRTDLARLSYQRFLALAPDSAQAEAARERLEALAMPETPGGAGGGGPPPAG